MRFTRRRAAGLIAFVLAVSVPAEIVFFREDVVSPAVEIADALYGVAFLLAGVVAWRQRPANLTGPLMIGLAFGWFAGALRFDSEPIVATLGFVFAGGLNGLFLGWLLLTFPSGRLETRFDRWLLAAIILQTTVLHWIRLLFWQPECTENGCSYGENLLVIDPAPGDVMFATAWSGNALLALVALLRVIHRVARASRPARHAMMPVLVAGTPTVLGILLVNIELMPYTVYAAVVLVLPFAFLWSVLRTRLTRSTIADLVIALGDLPPPERLRDALARALGDPGLRLGFWAPERQRYVDAAGHDLEVPEEDDRVAVTELRHGDRCQAVLVHDPALRADVGLVEAVGAAARLAIENARLQAEVRAQLQEVRASRRRIVEAADAERQRIERDLHDGAQQRLLSLALALRTITTREGDDLPADTRALLDQAAAEAQDALLDLRELARGVHPPVLVNDGLGPALETLAERAPLAVHLERLPERRLAAAVELAAYMVCSESLANATKHAHSSQVWIIAAEQGDQLVVDVRDDGVGGAVIEPSGGLAGLRDRVEAVGGRLEVLRAEGGGTRVLAKLPLNAADRVPA